MPSWNVLLDPRMFLQQTAKGTVAAQQQKFLHCLQKFRDKGAHTLETFLSTLSGEQLAEMVVDFLEDHWRKLKLVKSRQIREPWLVSGAIQHGMVWVVVMQSLEAHVFLKGNYLMYCAAPESPHCNFHRLIKIIGPDNPTCYQLLWDTTFR